MNATVVWLYERRRCWYLNCRKKARVEVTGFGCDHTAFCLDHFVFDLAQYHGLRPIPPEATGTKERGEKKK